MTVEELTKPVSLLDMVMLGGRERTAGEFRALLSRCGYEVQRVVPTPGMFAVIERGECSFRTKRFGLRWRRATAFASLTMFSGVASV